MVYLDQRKRRLLLPRMKFPWRLELWTFYRQPFDVDRDSILATLQAANQRTREAGVFE